MSISLLILSITILTGVVWVFSVLALHFGLGRIKRNTTDSQPPVTVLIAARNEQLGIARTLETLTVQDYPADRMEIIVIDDNSTDDTFKVVNSFTQNFPFIHLHRAGKTPEGLAPKKHALSVGIRLARGEIILATDADCRLPQGWVSGVVMQFAEDVDAVVGFSPLKGSGFIGALGRFDAFVNGVVSAGSIGIDRPVTAVGRNFAYRKSAWEKVGGFGANIAGASGDDDLLLQRIAGQGGKVVFNLNPDTFVQSDAKSSFGQWWRMKRRHLSAGKRYSVDLVLFSAALFLFQAGLLLSAACATFGIVNPIVTGLIWLLKATIDGLTLNRGARLLKVHDWIVPFIIAEVVSPLLFTILIPSALIGKITWKDRALKS